MTKTAIIRCEKNMDRCPMTNCLKCLTQTAEGFAGYQACMPAGIFTCHCPGDNLIQQAKILQAKGAEVIHFCTCTFSRKSDNGWELSKDAFCQNIDDLIHKVHDATGLPCVKGTAHLPEGYRPETWGELAAASPFP